MRILPVVMAAFLAIPYLAAASEVTFFLDGARIETVASAPKGYAEITLPASALPGSLRIKPAAGVTIDRVETVAVQSDPKQKQQLEKLTERVDRLQDRLKALSTRERIFTAAAKSQSGKAPRKTKNNPEPLSTIRQGTDFAIAQLEAVYQAKRKTEKELKTLELQLQAVKKAGNIGGSIVKAWLTGRGSVSFSYLITDLRWLPVYDLRVEDSGVAQVIQRASFPAVGKGVATAVIPGTMTESGTIQPTILARTSLPRVTSHTVHIEKPVLSASSQPVVSFSVTNGTGNRLPSGEAYCYYKGTFMGKFSFPGMAEGEQLILSCGK